MQRGKNELWFHSIWLHSAVQLLTTPNVRYEEPKNAAVASYRGFANISSEIDDNEKRQINEQNTYFRTISRLS